ncbi:MAG TPA: acyl-CoA dehydrogenase family protein [Xanthobacteraceae bacterium]|nr:acyl-CoA dehydrogenase family protein [Xanthobacteraceae bacterium]
MHQSGTTTPTPAELIARARAMIPLLAARAAKAEAERRVSEETIADMQAAGLFRVLQPRRWGGYEMDMATYFEIQLALAQGDMSVAWVYGVVGVHPWLMGLLEERAAQDVWGADDAMLVSSSLMPAGTLAHVSGGFRLSGRWKFSSGCQHCGWAFLGVNAARDPNAPPDRCVLLVPRSDYQIVDTWHVAGLKATGSHDIVVEDVFVPEHRLLQFVDAFRGAAPGLAVNTAPLYRLPFGQIFVRGVSTAALGALQGMLDAFLRYGAARVGRGGRTADDPVAQLAVAEAAAAIDEMKTILERDFATLADYAQRAELPPLRLRMEYKLHSALVAERCSNFATRLFRATGGIGIYNDQPFGRFLADINAGRQHISNQFEPIGRAYAAVMLGAEPAKDLML